jgi:hypothetical protein
MIAKRPSSTASAVAFLGCFCTSLAYWRLQSGGNMNDAQMQVLMSLGFLTRFGPDMYYPKCGWI